MADEKVPHGPPNGEQHGEPSRRDETSAASSIEFPVTVTVNGIKVEVVLLLRPGTQVAIKHADPEPPDNL